jgi:DnaJ-class molecular chaperone
MTDELKEVTRIGPALPASTVRYEPCHVCRGDGYVELYVNADGIGVCTDCATCAGRGTIAVEVAA